MDDLTRKILIFAGVIMTLALVAIGVVNLISISTLSGNFNALETRVGNIENSISTNSENNTSNNNSGTTVTPTVSSTIKKRTVKLYYKNYANDPQVMDCTSTDYVLRQVTDDEDVIKTTLQLLLDNKLTDEETQSGIVSGFQDTQYATQKASFKLVSLTVSNKIATVTFDDPKNFSSGGSCRASILKTSVENTLKQFSNITSVQFLPEDGLFQP